MVADPSSICGWNPDMYGVRNTEAGQSYYDSLIEMYAFWGVDFIKCDDFWDNWELLKNMFWRCELWQDHVKEGCFPDCDMLPNGRTLDDFPAETFAGRGFVLDCRGAAEITLPMLRRQEEALGEAEFLLFCTGWDRYWGQPRYYEGFPCLTAEAAEYAASLGLKGAGGDSISLDPCDTTDYPNHMILLGAGLVNTENLTGLEALVGKTFTFLTLPLKWEHADGSSCRAMAMLREEETR